MPMIVLNQYVLYFLQEASLALWIMSILTNPSWLCKKTVNDKCTVKVCIYT